MAPKLPQLALHKFFHSQTPSSQPKRRRKTWECLPKNAITRTWSYELFCSVTALLSFAAIIIVIAAYEGNSLPDLPYGLSINAIIAVFTAIIKASIGLIVAEGLSHLKWVSLKSPQPIAKFDIYDQASRGPWGAALFIKNFGWKLSHTVPTIGAVIMILLLPMDPLAQQLVRFYSCQRYATDISASTPRVMGLDTLRSRLSSPTNSDNDLYSQTLSSAISRGIFNPGQYQPFWKCDTGNCSFPETFNTLGYCSSCIDVSDTMIKEMNEGTFDYLGKAVQSLNFTYTLPGRSINNTIHQWSVYSDPGRFRYRRESFSMEVDTHGLAGDSGYSPNAFRSSPTTPAMNISIIRSLSFPIWEGFSEDDPREWVLNTTLDWEVAGYTCSLTPCVQTYLGSKVIKNELKEDIDPFKQTNWGLIGNETEELIPVLYAMVDLECLEDREHQDSILRALGYQFNESTRWLPYNASFALDPRVNDQMFTNSAPLDPNLNGKNWYTSALSQTDIEPSTFHFYEEWKPLLKNGSYLEGYYILNRTAREIVPSGCIYHVTDAAVRDLEVVLAEYFRGKLETQYGSQNSLQAIYYAGSGNGTLEDVQGLMSRVADAITLHMRAHPGADTTPPVQGMTIQDSICLQVQWAWIIYIASSIALFMGFFIAILILSRRTQLRMSQNVRATHRSEKQFHDFKSSTYPILLCGTGPRSNDGKIFKTGTTKELEKLAADLRITMEPTADGWKVFLVEQDRRPKKCKEVV